MRHYEVCGVSNCDHSSGLDPEMYPLASCDQAMPSGLLLKAHAAGILQQSSENASRKGKWAMSCWMCKRRSGRESGSC